MAEIKANCREGTLIVDDTMIRTKRIGREMSMPRAMLVGIETKMGPITIFGTTQNVTFFGQGNQQLHAHAVPSGKVKQIRASLRM